MIEWYPEFLKALVAAIIGYLFYVVKKGQSKLDESITEARAKELIAEQIALVYERQKDIKEDLNRVEKKLDYLITLLVRKKITN